MTLVLAAGPSVVAAQSNLGELLDAGAQKLSTEEFRRDIVQRTLVGPNQAGITVEIMYAANGSIAGAGSVVAAAAYSQHTGTGFTGAWTINDAGWICASLQTPGAGTAFTNAAVLPPRCQAWFKLGDVYFISDSDSDRRAKVLRRTIQPTSAAALTPSNLGQLLAAGGIKLSAAEFKRDVTQRTIVGPLPDGGDVAVTYAADGSIQGTARALAPYPWPWTVSGAWEIADDRTVCTTMKAVQSFRTVTTEFPRRCQFWFKLGDDYFVSDSDADREAKVLRRTIKQ